MACRKVDAEFESVRTRLRVELDELKRDGAVFAIVVDEWSSGRKRFVGVLLCCSRPIPSLGSGTLELLSRFRERATAENLLSAI